MAEKLPMRFVLVLSNKGGVGKSTIATALARALTKKYVVGLLDVDITNPSIPKLTGTEGVQFTFSSLLNPVQKGKRLRIASVSFVLPEKGLPLMFNGATASEFAAQFIKSIDWRGVKHFIVDTPPGTGDETLRIINAFVKESGAVIVTTPQELSVDNVTRTITMCKEVNLPIIGLIENMSEFICPKCKEAFPLGSDIAEKTAKMLGVKYIGKIPFDLEIAKETDAGRTTTIAKMETFKRLITEVDAFLGGK